MGGLDTGGGGGGSGASAGRHKKKRGKRVGIKMDMTPMVDVAFLLLTFFMLTAVFSQPLAMEINLPPPTPPGQEEEPIDIAESNVMMLRADARGGIYTAIGNEVPKKVTLAELTPALRAHATKNDQSVVVLKVDREADYQVAIDLLDEIDVADVKRFAISNITVEDARLLQEAGAQVSPPREEPAAAAPGTPAPAASAAPAG